MVNPTTTTGDAYYMSIDNIDELTNDRSYRENISFCSVISMEQNAIGIIDDTRLYYTSDHNDFVILSMLRNEMCMDKSEYELRKLMYNLDNELFLNYVLQNKYDSIGCIDNKMVLNYKDTECNYMGSYFLSCPLEDFQIYKGDVFEIVLAAKNKGFIKMCDVMKLKTTNMVKFLINFRRILNQDENFCHRHTIPKKSGKMIHKKRTTPKKM